MDVNQLFTEARAKIIWGEPPLAVRVFLTSNGVPRTVAEAKVKEFVGERNMELRSIGMRDVFIGAVLLGVAGFIAFIVFRASLGSSSGIAKVLVLAALAALYGLWKLVNGIIYLVRPQSKNQSLPDMDDSDPLD